MPEREDQRPRRIEPAFAEIKQALRRIGARSWDTVAAAIGDALVTVTAVDARAFFTAAGFPAMTQLRARRSNLPTRRL